MDMFQEKKRSKIKKDSGAAVIKHDRSIQMTCNPQVKVKIHEVM